MTFDLPTAVIVGGVLSVLGAATSYAARAIVLDRITALEASRDSMGKRFGDGLAEVKQWQAIREDRESRPHG